MGVFLKYAKDIDRGDVIDLKGDPYIEEIGSEFYPTKPQTVVGVEPGAAITTVHFQEVTVLFPSQHRVICTL